MEKSRRNKYLLKNTAIFAIGNFATKFIAFFLVPIYTNVLSTSDYGTVDLTVTLSNMLLPILTLNISDAILRFTLDKNAKKDSIIDFGVVVLAVATIIGIGIIPISILSDKISNYAIYFYFYLITLMYSQVLLVNLRGKELLIQYSIGNFIHSLTIAVFNIIFLVVLNKGIEGYFIAYIISNVITAVYAFIVANVLSSLKKFSLDVELIKEMLKYSIVLIPTSFMWWIINSSDRIMVTYILGTAANGILAIAYKIPTLLSTITNIFTQAWMYSAINEKDSKDEKEYTNRIFNGLFSIVMIIAAGLLMIIRPFLSVYVSSSYSESWKYTPFLIIGFAFLTLATFISTSYNVHKDSKGFLYSGVCGAIINIIFNFLLIPVIGISGATIATCTSYIVVFIYRMNDTKKYVKIDLYLKHYLSFILLFFSAITVFYTTILGQSILIIEFLLMIIILRNEWIPIFLAFCSRIAKRKNNH